MYKAYISDGEFDVAGAIEGFFTPDAGIDRTDASVRQEDYLVIELEHFAERGQTLALLLFNTCLVVRTTRQRLEACARASILVPALCSLILSQRL
jgi:predicted metal-dependent HD superfamily phosphohydrolase